jgi:hypothetical protein
MEGGKNGRRRDAWWETENGMGCGVAHYHWLPCQSGPCHDAHAFWEYVPNPTDLPGQLDWTGRSVAEWAYHHVNARADEEHRPRHAARYEA